MDSLDNNMGLLDIGDETIYYSLSYSLLLRLYWIVYVCVDCLYIIVLLPI